MAHSLDAASRKLCRDWQPGSVVVRSDVISPRFGFVQPRGSWRLNPLFPSCMLVNSSAGEVIFGENFLSLLYSSPDSWCKRFFRHDSGSVIRPKLHRPIFACFVQSRMPLSLVSSLFLWSEFICVVSSFASSSHSLPFCSDHPIASCESREIDREYL